MVKLVVFSLCRGMPAMFFTRIAHKFFNVLHFSLRDYYKVAKGEHAGVVTIVEERT